MINLTQDQWVEKIEEDINAVIIDARRPDEWEDGILENSLMMDIMDFENFHKKASQLESNKNYYVYCRSGVRSINACQVLESLGYEQTYNLLGGILEWEGKTVLPQ